MPSSFSPAAAVAGVPSGAIAATAGRLAAARRMAEHRRWTFLAFAQYLLPLAVLETYLSIRDLGSPLARLAMAGVLGCATLLTALGIGAAAMIMWLPRMGG